MRIAWITLVAAWVASGLAACSHPAPPAEPPSGRAEPATAPATPGPRVAWVDGTFAITGLPAIASDGSVVVVAHIDSDSARGNPNLTLITRDRNDRVVAQLVVLTANEAEANPNPAGRVATAQAWLDEQHRAARLVPLAKLGQTQGEKRDTVTAGQTTVRWAGSELAITDGGTPLASRATPATWLAKDHPMCDQCNGEICHNPAFLDSAYLDTARKAALVIVLYEGTDTCWEPAGQEHVIAW